MKIENEPVDDGSAWNTEDMALHPVTCRQLSNLMTGFVDSLRSSAIELDKNGIEGLVSRTARVLIHQIQTLQSDQYSTEEKMVVKDNVMMAFQAICLGSLMASSRLSVKQIVELSYIALEAVDKCEEKVGPIATDDEIFVNIRRKANPMEGDQDAIQMGIAIESVKPKSKEQASIKLQPPDIDPGQSGRN